MNAFTAPPALSPTGASGPPPQPSGPMTPGAPSNAMMGAPSPSAAPSGFAPPPPTPEIVNQARTHIGAIVDGLTDVLGKPKGELTKKDVFDAASEMIARGAFPTPESRQSLIAELAKLPDDEPDLRKALGALLMQTADVKHRVHLAHGPGES